MEKDYASEMMLLKESLEKEGKQIQNIMHIGKMEVIELINKEKYKLPKDIYLCNEILVDKDGNEIPMDEYYTEDFKLLAFQIKDERYEQFENDITLSEEYEGLLDEKDIEIEKNRIREQLKELLKSEKIHDLNHINEEKVKSVAQTLGIKEEEIKYMSEVNLQEDEEKKESKHVEGKTVMSIDANEMVSSGDTISSLLKIQGKGYNKVDFLSTTQGVKVVGIKENGENEELENLTPVGNYVSNPTNMISPDGNTIEEKHQMATFAINGSAQDRIAFGIGKQNTPEVSYIRNDPHTNTSIGTRIQSNTIVHTSGEERTLMNGRQNGSVEEEARRIKDQKENGIKPIETVNIDDNSDNDKPFELDDETCLKAANIMGYRGSTAENIEIGRKLINEKHTKDPSLTIEQIEQQIENDADEQMIPGPKDLDVPK